MWDEPYITGAYVIPGCGAAETTGLRLREGFARLFCGFHRALQRKTGLALESHKVGAPVAGHFQYLDNYTVNNHPNCKNHTEKERKISLE